MKQLISWCNALESLDSVLESVEVVSLDFFDTLVRRRFDPPDYVSELLAEELLRLAPYSRDGLSAELVRIRRTAECEAREHRASLFGDSECSHWEIFHQFNTIASSDLGWYSLPTASELADIEFSLDKSCMELMPAVSDFLISLRERQKNIIIISDTYYSSSSLSVILQSLGVCIETDSIFSSSDHRKSKVRGDLYTEVIRRLAVPPEHVLHIGDNFLSDVVRARQQLIRSLHFNSDSEVHRRKQTSVTRSQIYHQPGVLARATESSSQVISISALDGNAAFALGFCNYGMLYSGFAYEVSEKIARGGYDKVYFLERDSSLILNLVKEILSKLPRYRNTTYAGVASLHVDRTILNLALCGQSRSLERIMIPAILEESTDHIAEVLSSPEDTYLDGSDRFSDLLRRNPGIKLKDLVSMREGLALFMDECERLYHRLVAYLDHVGLLNLKNFLVIDIGWAGTIPRGLHQLVTSHRGWCRMEAFFLGFTGKYHGVLGSSDAPFFHVGYLADCRRQSPAGAKVTLYREFFEVFSCSGVGHHCGFRRSASGEMTPVYFRTPASNDEESIRLEVQRGIREYCSYFTSVVRDMALDRSRFRDAALESALESIEMPSQAQRAIYGRLSFDFGRGVRTRVPLSSLCPAESAGIRAKVMNLPLQPIRTSDEGVSYSIEAIQSLFEKLYYLIQVIKIEYESIVIYGIGTVASILSPPLVEKIRFFVDRSNSHRGGTFLGKEIFGVEEGLKEVGQSLLLITPLGRRSQIIQKIEPIGCKFIFVEDYLGQNS